MWQAVVPGIIVLLALTLVVILFIWDRRRSAKLIRDSAAMILRGEEQARAAIAQELHDNLGHRLYDLRFRIIRGGRAEVEDISSLLLLVSRLSHQLHPGEAVAGDFKVQLTGLVEQVRADLGVEVGLELAEDCTVEGEAALALYRITQEALTNAHRHGKAGRITITLERSGQVARLVVEDDGVGIGSGVHSTTGLGIRSMKQRMVAVGGKLAVGPGIGGRGTRVEAEVPA